MEQENDKNKCNRNEYYSNWYKNNKEKHLKYVNEKVEYECGQMINRVNVCRHLKTSIHNKNMQKKLPKV